MSAAVLNRTLRDYIEEELQTLVPNTRKVLTANGLIGGGELSGDITIDGVNATTTQIGVARFATAEELRAGTSPNLMVSPDDISGRNVGVGASGQRWHDVTTLRSKSTTYTNTTSSPIMVSIVCSGDRGNPSARLMVNGKWVAVIADAGAGAGAVDSQLTTIVPIGSTYELVTNGVLQLWAELRNGRA